MFSTGATLSGRRRRAYARGAIYAGTMVGGAGPLQELGAIHGRNLMIRARRIAACFASLTLLAWFATRLVPRAQDDPFESIDDVGGPAVAPS